MRDATLCFLVKGRPPRDILLGYKKVRFGAGKYNGFGGKVGPGETVRAAAARELEEEAGVRVVPADLHRVGELDFFFPARPAWDQTVHVFLVHRWDGTPAESEEMQPSWFAVDRLPFGRMWQDDVHWLPRVLAGERVRARFTFGQDNETLGAYEIQPLEE